MTTGERILLTQKISEDFRTFCDKQVCCEKCKYFECDDPCEIIYTMSYLNKRKLIKGGKK